MHAGQNMHMTCPAIVTSTNMYVSRMHATGKGTVISFTPFLLLVSWFLRSSPCGVVERSRVQANLCIKVLRMSPLARTY